MPGHNFTIQRKERRRGRTVRVGQHYRLNSKYRDFSPSDVRVMTKKDVESIWMRFAFPLTNGTPYCPRCGDHRHTLIKTRNQYRCCGCERRYSKTSGTAFACRKMSIRNILYAIAEFQFEADAHSAVNLAGRLKVTYKTAWVLAHKIRELMAHARKNDAITEDVAIDGAYFGGSYRPANILKNRKDQRRRPKLSKNQKVVVAIKARVTNSTILVNEFDSEEDALDWVRSVVPANVKIFTDKGSWWNVLKLKYDHHSINHTEAFKLGDCDTNAVESFFATMRVAESLYRSVSRRYFQRYVQEQVWRRSAKSYDSNFDRFLSLVRSCEGLKTSFRGYWQIGGLV